MKSRLGIATAQGLSASSFTNETLDTAARTVIDSVEVALRKKRRGKMLKQILGDLSFPTKRIYELIQDEPAGSYVEQNSVYVAKLRAQIKEIVLAEY